mgnify:CR=1 FL=1
MGRIIYALLDEPKKPKVDEIPQKITVEKMRLLAVEKQKKELGLSSGVEVFNVGYRQFKLRYEDTELELMRTQLYTPYIGKHGKLVVVPSGQPELEKI